MAYALIVARTLPAREPGVPVPILLAGAETLVDDGWSVSVLAVSRAGGDDARALALGTRGIEAFVLPAVGAAGDRTVLAERELLASPEPDLVIFDGWELAHRLMPDVVECAPRAARLLAERDHGLVGHISWRLGDPGARLDATDAGSVADQLNVMRDVDVVASESPSEAEVVDLLTASPGLARLLTPAMGDLVDLALERAEAKARA